MCHAETPKFPSLALCFLATALFVAALWWIKVLDNFFGWDLSLLGVYPHELRGLIGVLTAPLIHGSFAHLFANTAPLLMLGATLLYGYPRSRWIVVAVVWVGAGLGAWFTGRESFHFGASGLTHGLMFYLFLAGVLRRDRLSIVLAMLPFFLYGGMVWGIFPNEPEISFESHFWGAISGTPCALLLRKVDPKPPEKRYWWEDEPADAADPVIGDQWQIKGPPQRDELEDTGEIPIASDDKEEKWH